MIPLDGAGDRAAWVRHAAETLSAAGFEDARADAELLWCRASGENRAMLALRHGEAAPTAALARFQAWLVRFTAGEPLAYLEGSTGFHGLEFLCDARALIPRADSEAVVELALSLMHPQRPARIADLGTGSGCLLLTLLHLRAAWRGIGVDRSLPALELARSNALRLALEVRSSFAQADWLDGVPGPFELIVSNPPYVVPGEELGRGVAEHEPHAALFTPARDSMHAYRRILKAARTALAPHGTLVFEIGSGRASELATLADALGWQECGRQRDLSGIERALAFRTRGSALP